MIHTEGRVVLRKEDEDECWLSGASPEVALRASIDGSTRAYEVIKDGVTLAYWGWARNSFLTASCRAWMLSTPAIEQHPVFAARRSREYLEMLLAEHHSVSVIVDPSYEKAIRWLGWLGFRRVGPWDRFLEMRVERGGCA